MKEKSGNLAKYNTILYHHLFVCLFFFFFFYNTQYDAVLLKKIKRLTRWNGVISRITKPLKDMQIVSVQFGSVGNRFRALWFDECIASASEVHLSSDCRHRLYQSMAAAMRDDRRRLVGSVTASPRSLLVISPNLNPKLKFYFFAHLWHSIYIYIYIYRFLAWIHWPMSTRVSVSSSCRIKVEVFN